MNASEILARLSKVRQSSRDEWVACCPAHQDKTPSLSVKDCGDGRILMHCHADCMIEDVCGAIGLTLADLMPEKPLTHLAVKPAPFSPLTELEALAYQATIVSIAASDMCRGKPLSIADKDRLFEIAGRINRVVEHVTG